MALQWELPVAAATQLVGREAELQAIRDALRATLAPAAVVLEGEPGIGKSALWQAAIAEAEELGRRVVAARPAAAESNLSHAALGDLLAGLGDERGDDLPAPQRRALDVALLRASPGAEPVDARAVGAATLGLLRAASRRAPLLLAIDDLQWIDAASAAAVAFALRRLAGEPVVLLATRRRGRDAQSIELGVPPDRIARIGVGPLELGTLQRVLRERLDEPVPRPALARLADVSGGNPYYALELARAALREAGGAGLGAELTLPDGIYAVLHDRLRALPDDTREALAAIAAMGHPTVAAASAAVDAGTLDEAFAAGVLYEQRDRIQFEHPLLAEAAYRLQPPSRRRAMHARLAKLASDVEERARHLAAATSAPDGRVAAELAAGAQAAAARGAPAASARLLEASARLEPEPDVAAQRRVAAVRHHTAAGDGRRAIALATTLMEELPPGPLRSRALVARADLDGDIGEMLALASQAVEEAGDDIEAKIEALVSNGTLLSLSGNDDAAYDCMRGAKALCDPDTPRSLRVMAMGGYAEYAQSRGEPGGMGLLREAAELEGDDVIPNAYWGPGAVLARALVFVDELEEGRRLLERRYRRALELGDDDSRVGLLLHLAELEIKEGRFDAALRCADEGIAIQEGSYAEQAQGALTYVRALALACLGDTRRAREVAERGLERCDAQGDVLFATMHRMALGFLEFSLRRDPEALEWISPIAQRFAEKPGDPSLPHLACIPDAIECLTRLERLDDADELLAAWERASERFDRPRARATAARGQALLAAALGDVDAALRHAQDSVGRLRALPAPFDLARSLVVLGSVQRRARRKAAARAALEEALESFRAMAAPLWEQRANDELARIGGRARSDGLTPTEARVAELVAEGRSNKEVADALFVTVRTVEANLTRVYAKLGIRSRTELASRRRR